MYKDVDDQYQRVHELEGGDDIKVFQLAMRRKSSLWTSKDGPSKELNGERYRQVLYWFGWMAYKYANQEN